MVRRTRKKIRGGRLIQSLSRANKQDIAENFYLNYDTLLKKVYDTPEKRERRKENIQKLAENMNQTFLTMWDERIYQEEYSELDYLDKILREYWVNDEDVVNAPTPSLQPTHWWEKEEHKRPKTRNKPKTHKVTQAKHTRHKSKTPTNVVLRKAKTSTKRTHSF